MFAQDVLHFDFGPYMVTYKVAVLSVDTQYPDDIDAVRNLYQKNLGARYNKHSETCEVLVMVGRTLRTSMIK